jgi:hypothetical protein
MKVAKHDRSAEKEIKRRIASKEYVFANEEVELDELKKSTLASYIKKATPSAMDQGVKGMDFKNENRPKHFNKAMSRMTGIQKAADKLAKEEVELDELNKSTLGSYVKKASTNQIGNTAAVLANKNDSETDRARKRMGNRMSGIAKATDRLTKEEVEQIDELSKKTLGSYVKKASADRSWNSFSRGHLAGMEADHDAKKMIKKDQKRMFGINRATDKLAKEEVELDEVSKSTLGRYVKAASTDAARKTSEKDSVDRDYPNRSFSDRLGYKKELGKKLNRRRVGISKAVDRLTKEEVEQIDEAFKIGAMKLKDGSSVTLTRESVDALNGLFSQLNSANKSKMEERMMSGKKGFQEILSFAENV